MMKCQATAALVVASMLGIGAPASANIVTDWNTAALNAIRASGARPPNASRALAILHASIYDAIIGIDRGYEPYLVNSAVPRTASKEAAATVAAYEVLINLFPESSPAFDRLKRSLLATIRDHPQKTMGMQWGESVAHQILAARAADGWNAPFAPPSGTGPGAWVPTPPDYEPYVLPQWGFVAPFTMPTSSYFRPQGPPALNSAKWAADYNEVKAYGAAVGSLRTPDQDQIALFWADDIGTETPGGHWNTIAATVSARRGNTLEETARLFALLNIAMADAGIAAWDAKYTYDFWRPITAIRNGDTDGNDATIADPSWTPFIRTPGFPEYVSGHSTFSAAASTILARFYGTDRIAFTVGSDALPGVTRSFTTFSQAAEEAMMSRIFGGIHYRSADEDGRECGLSIGEWTFAHYLEPKGDHSR